MIIRNSKSAARFSKVGHSVVLTPYNESYLIIDLVLELEIHLEDRTTNLTLLTTAEAEGEVRYL